MASMTGRNAKDVIADTFHPLYERMFGEYSQFKADVDRKLGEALWDDPIELFLSRAVGYGVITGLVLWILSTVGTWAALTLLGIDVGTLLGVRIQNPMVLKAIELLKVPALILTTGVIFGAIGFAAGFLGPVSLVYVEASSRKRAINHLMPDAVAFMYALSVGGMNQLEILKSMAKANDVYGEVAQEFQSIIYETQYFGVDYRTAIRNRAVETPSQNLGQFLTDMLSIISSGGDMEEFLDEKRRKYIRTATQQQEQTLETLELFGQMYMTLALFPLLFIILLVIMNMVGSMNDMLLFMSVYGMIPMVGVTFIVLIGTVKQDETGAGELTASGAAEESETSTMNVGVIDNFDTEFGLLDQIQDAETQNRIKEILTAPHKFFLEKPAYTFVLSAPIALAAVGGLVAVGSLPTSYKAMYKSVVWSTFGYFYLPMYIAMTPYIIFYEIKAHRKNKILNNLSQNLRKLASANDTGQTLLESFRTVATTSSGRIGYEFNVIYNKVRTGTSMKQSIREFTNKYEKPRLARMMKLISKAQETSSNITPVLHAAADSSEQADEMEKEQKTQARMQIVIIIMTYLTLLVVMVILKVKFLDTMASLVSASSSAGGASSAGGGAVGGGMASGINVERLSLLFFHAVTLQAVTSGMVAGYMRSGDLRDSAKFIPVLSTISLVAWMFV